MNYVFEILLLLVSAAAYRFVCQIRVKNQIKNLERRLTKTCHHASEELNRAEGVRALLDLPNFVATTGSVAGDQIRNLKALQLIAWRTGKDCRDCATVLIDYGRQFPQQGRQLLGQALTAEGDCLAAQQSYDWVIHNIRINMFKSKPQAL